MAAHDATLPDLELHDILNDMSPSPTPLHLDSAQNRPRSITPEMLTEADIAQMRHRVCELKASSQGLVNLTERETELFDMVRRLTESTLVEPRQLICQAEVISRLTVQRDFLIRQMEEERGRWMSQRDGWERIAEALIAQRSKSLSGPTKEDIDRYCAAYQSENKTLREKLSDTSSRLQHLEAEITKLRPILLMQPVTTATAISHHTSVLSGVPYPSIQAAVEKAKPKKKKKEPRVPVFSANARDEQEPQEQVEIQHIYGVEKTATSSSFFQFQAQPILPPTTQPAFTGDHYRKPAAAQIGGPLTAPPTTLEFQVSTPGSQLLQTVRTIRRCSPDTSAPELPTPGRTNSIPKKSKRNGPPTLLTSDARTEHLLLAARKIGRERAGVVAGYVRDRQKELDMQKRERERERIARELEREQAEKERLERIAERGPGGLSYYRRDVVEAGSSNNGKAMPGSSPRTPRKGEGSQHLDRDASGSGSPTPPGPSVNTAFVLIEASVKGKGKAPQKLQTGSWSTNMQDTSQQQQQQSGTAGASAAQQTQPQTNPSTPLSSLIDAARMIGSNDETSVQARNGGGGRGRKNGVNGGSEVFGGAMQTEQGRRRGVAADEVPESPAPKRRRVASARAAAAAAAATNNSSRNGSGSDNGSGRRNGNGDQREGMECAMTALHVLADQAAAFSSHDQRGKGKFRDVQDEESSEGDDGKGDGDYAPIRSSTGTRRGRRGRPSAKEKEKEKSKPKTTTSRKTRGKAAAVTPAAAPRLISSPAPKSSSGPSLSSTLPPGDVGTVSATATTDTTNLYSDKSSAQASQLGNGDTASTSRYRGGNIDEEHLAGALLQLVPPAEIYSRSQLPHSPSQDGILRTHGFPSPSEGSKRVAEIKPSGDQSTAHPVEATASEDGQGPMDVDSTPALCETVETGTDDSEPAIELLLKPDADDGSLGDTPHNPSSSYPNDVGDIEDDEADAEGDADAEGELDLEEETATQILLDSTIATGGFPSLPIGDHKASQLSSQ